MAETEAKKTETTKAAAKKGFYIVTPERKGAGPSKEVSIRKANGVTTRKYMQIHSVRSASKEGG